MRGEALSLGEAFDSLRDVAQAGLRKLLHGDQLQEIEDAEASAKARLTCRGQDVIGAGGVISGSLWGIVTDEDGSGVLNEGNIVAIDGDVLRREFIGPSASLYARRG